MASRRKRKNDSWFSFLDAHRLKATLASLAANAPVTLGLNLAEAERIAHVLGAPDAPSQPHVLRLPALAHAIRTLTRVHEVVIHPREGAAVAWASGTDWADGPFTPTPRLSTGAGDHFNAGYAFARARGLPPDLALHAGAAASGAYVRDAASPDSARLIDMLRSPAP